MECQFMRDQSIEKSKRDAGSQTDIYCDKTSNDDISSMAKLIAILSYITLLGWLAAMLLHGSQNSTFTSFHLRQSLGLIVTGALLALIPLVGWFLNIAVFFAWLYAVYHVVMGHTQKIPLLGDFYQEHLDFIK